MLGLIALSLVAARAPGAEWVGRTRLRSVQSVDCLRRLQVDPQDPCAPKPQARLAADAIAGEGLPGAWSTGNFPRPLIPELQGGDPRCGAHNELLCDPDGILNEADQKSLARTLQMIRENLMVPCRLPWLRAQDQTVPSSARVEDEHQFRVGVALLESLPVTSLDPASLELFGEYLLSTWEVSPNDCAAGAILIVVPNAEKSWLVAPSCRYVCGSDADTGGRVLNVLETSLGWRATAKDGELQSADYLSAIENSLHELEDVMHRQRGMAFSSGRAVVPQPDDLWRRRKEREWSDVAPWVEGATLVLVVGLFAYMAHWYTQRFYGGYLEEVRAAFKGLRTG